MNWTACHRRCRYVARGVTGKIPALCEDTRVPITARPLIGLGIWNASVYGRPLSRFAGVEANDPRQSKDGLRRRISQQIALGFRFQKR